jgi:hypothetical protein
MTEADWFSCSDPQLMLAFLHERGASERKRRLFACACCRDVWDLIVAMEEARIGYGCRAVLSAERCADGLAPPYEVNLGFADLIGMIDSGSSPASQLLQGALPALAGAPERAAADAARHCARARYQDVKGRAMRRRGEWDTASSETLAEARDASAAAMAHQCDLLRCIMGTPFGQQTFDQSWRTETAVALARQQYESRDFLLMPIMGDALADAGCPDGDVLEHCRGPNNHVRGCHVVDLVLNRS